jgi:hypothetical protein
MKKLISVLLVLAFVLATATTAFAAEAKKYSDCTTNAEKIQWFKDTYGVTGALAVWNESYVGKNGLAVQGRMLDTMYTGFSLIGQSSTKKIFDYHIAGEPKIIFNIYLGPDTYGNDGNANASKGQIYLDFRADYSTGYTAQVPTVVHEVMHVYDRVSEAGSKAVANLNGSYSVYTNSNQYVTQYAATSAFEDFAETAASMIYNGGDSPCTLDKSTILYKKYKACYDLLLDSFGVNSNAVKRSAAFLGIELPTE